MLGSLVSFVFAQREREREREREKWWGQVRAGAHSGESECTDTKVVGFVSLCVRACDSDRLVDVIRRFIVCVVQSPIKCVDIIKIPLFVRAHVCVFCLSLAKQAREN